MLLAKTKFAFTFDQEKHKNYVNKTFFFYRSRELTSIIQRRKSHFQSQLQALLVVFLKIILKNKKFFYQAAS